MSSPRRHTPRRLLQLAMALFAVVAIVFFWTVEAQACSMAFPPPDCDVEVTELNLPDCVTADVGLDDRSESCRFDAYIDNQCDDGVQISFFCDGEQPEYRCPDDRVVDSNDSINITLDEVGNYDYEHDIGLLVEVLEDDNDESSDDNGEADDNGDVQSSVSVSMTAEEVEYETPTCPQSDHTPFGCANSTSSPAPVPVIAGLLVLAAAALFRRSSGQLSADNSS